MVKDLAGGFKDVLNRYASVYQEVVKNSDWKNTFRETIASDIPEMITSSLSLKEPYKVVGSYGKGRWTTVPWVAIFDTRITSSAQQGVYIVYLVNKDTKELFLTFEVAATETLHQGVHDEHHSFVGIVGKMNPQVADKLSVRASQIRSVIGDTYFCSDSAIRSGSDGYDSGAVYYKKYTLADFPDNDVLLADLERMMEIYQKYQVYEQSFTSNLVESVHHSIGSFDSWEIIDENTAIKTCDKSFFEHNESGVPKEICWFFNIQSVQLGESRQVPFTYNGKDYLGKISNASSDRVRIYWNADLGNVFNRLRSKTTQRLIFTKTKDRYVIRFEGDEQEVTTKQTISEIKRYIAAAGFTYPDGMIENFWLSLKSKPFVILAGTSGTGKTRLVRLFAKAISAEYKLVPVRPDWSDSSDLFGHVDLNGNFFPGSVLDFMNQAKANPHKPYILCLDEMNLARVEYYLSDVLSVMETREVKNGTIESDPILTESYYGRDHAARERYGIQRIPENFYLVGTVNMDETTFPFSRKVLDRANTIEFSYVDLAVDFDAIPDSSESRKVSNDFLKTEYLFLSQCAADKEYVVKVCDALQKINGILQEGNAHVGYRVRDEIVFYMLNNKNAGLIDEKTAFDNEIMQKILPRIQGSSASVKKLLCNLFAELEGSYSDSSGSDSENMQNYIKAKANQLRHPQSANKIFFMTRRFEEDGFTSYWL